MDLSILSRMWGGGMTGNKGELIVDVMILIEQASVTIKVLLLLTFHVLNGLNLISYPEPTILLGEEQRALT